MDGRDGDELQDAEPGSASVEPTAGAGATSRRAGRPSPTIDMESAGDGACTANAIGTAGKLASKRGQPARAGLPCAAAAAEPTARAIDFGGLARAVRDERCIETLDALWREAFALESWFFIARPDDGGGGACDGVAPQLVERNGRCCVLVFTDEFGALRHQARHEPHPPPGRLRHSGHPSAPKLNGMRPTAGGGAPPQRCGPATSDGPLRPALGYATIEVDVEASVVLLRKLACDGVQTVVFNEGIAGFEMAIAPLVELHRSIRGAGNAGPAGGSGAPGPGAAPSAVGSTPSAEALLMETIVLPCPPGQIDLEAILARAADRRTPREPNDAGGGGTDGPGGTDGTERPAESAKPDGCGSTGPTHGPGGATGGGHHGGNDDGVRVAAIAALLSLDAWWFICNPRKPDEVFVARLDGEPSVLAYTDERQAIVATERHRLVARDGSILLLEMPVRDAVDWIHRFLRHGVRRLTFNERSTPVTISIAELSESWRRTQEHTR